MKNVILINISSIPASGLRHILQDTNSAYKQCAYSYPLTNRRCLQAAPKYDTKKNKHFTMFCFEHSRLSQLTKTRTAVGRLKKPDDPEGFLSGLAHYVNMDGAPPGAEDDIVIDVENTMTVDPTSRLRNGFWNRRLLLTIRFF